VSLENGEGGVPVLLITGPADDLANQARLLGSDLATLALSSKVVTGPINSRPLAQASPVTLKDLGQPGGSATALKPQVAVSLDQTRLGQPVHDLRVQLKGSYTPLPSTVGGQVVISADGETIDQFAADPSGRIDRSISIPQSELRRDTELSVAVDIAGDVGQCGDFQPVTLKVDDDTTIESTPANPPDPAGFQSIPQALLPEVEVGVEPESFGDTARAVAIMEGLQRLSGPRLGAEVVPFDSAVDSSSPAILISADGWDNDKVVPPVRNSASGVIEAQRVDGGSPATLTLDPATPFASLQVGRSGNRTVLFATSENAPEQLDSLLDWLDGDVRRWAALDGTAAISLPDREPVTVDTDVVAPPDASDDSGTSVYWWIAACAGVAVGAVVIVMVILRRRRG
jgi:hypothetical protein